MSTDQQLLCLACRKGDLRLIRGILSQESPDSRKRFVNFVTKTGWTPLLRAAANGFTSIVDFLLTEGADVNVSHKRDGWTALHLACQHGSQEVVLHLLSRKAHLSAVNTAGETPLHTATNNSQTQVVDFLLEAKADPNAQSESGESAVHVACRKFSKAILQSLLSFKGSISQPDSEGTTPLVTALEARCVHSIQLLLSKCASLTVANKAGQDPVQRAAELGLTHVVDIFNETLAQRRAQKKLAKLLVARVSPSTSDVSVVLWRRLFGGPSLDEQNQAFVPVHGTWLCADSQRKSRIQTSVEQELAANVCNLRGMIGRRVALRWADGRWYVNRQSGELLCDVFVYSANLHATSRYRGRVTEFSPHSMRSLVLYDDGDSKQCVLYQGGDRT